MQSDNTDSNIIHDLDEVNKKSGGLPYGIFIGLIIIVIVLGAIGGLLLTRVIGRTEDSQSQLSKSKTTGKTAGIADKKTFKDKAEGILKEGGIEGEGNFHLARPGGESQNVYLTSTTVDLSHYLGKKVRVWGETFAAQKAGWLMDVGLVELLQ